VGQKNLPVASGEDHACAFEACGWIRRKTGNHIILTKPGEKATLSIPNHGEVKRALLQKQIKIARLSEAEYLAAFAAR
jgi:HicA toxin of bacterial toxin-antitoxin,